jgi:AcrR family transcriptional regulator
MGIRERQERDREAVRRAILDAARDLFVRVGFEHVSIRKIAEMVEYSPAAIYGYFPSKDDIFFALAEEGFRLLHGDQQLFEALEALPPLERVRGIFRQFYRFSSEHPQYFALMFVDRSVPRITREYERFAFTRDMKGLLVRHLREAVDAGVLPADAAPEVILRILSTALIGVAVMRLSDRLAPGEDADALADDVLDVTLAGLQAGVRLRSLAPSALCPLDQAPRPHDTHDTHDTHVSYQESRS